MSRLSGPIAAVAFLAASAAAADGDGISLAVTSPEEATPFTAECTIAGAEGERRQTWESTTPLEVTFEGARGLRCRLESSGTLDVEARGPGGNVSRTRTTGGTVTLNLGG